MGAALRPARFPADRAYVVELFREYEQFLGIDLGFQDFEREVAALPGKYAPPRGNIVLAREGDAVAGCIAWYPFSDDTCEVKRLYVRPAWRGRGIGRELLAHTIGEARQGRYTRIIMDSLERLKEAGKLYASLGFRRIAPFNVNPLPDVYYMELQLSHSPIRAAEG